MFQVQGPVLRAVIFEEKIAQFTQKHFDAEQSTQQFTVSIGQMSQQNACKHHKMTNLSESFDDYFHNTKDFDRQINKSLFVSFEPNVCALFWGFQPKIPFYSAFNWNSVSVKVTFVYVKRTKSLKIDTFLGRKFRHGTTKTTNWPSVKQINAILNNTVLVMSFWHRRI